MTPSTIRNRLPIKLECKTDYFTGKSRSVRRLSYEIKSQRTPQHLPEANFLQRRCLRRPIRHVVSHKLRTIRNAQETANAVRIVDSYSNVLMYSGSDEPVGRILKMPVETSP
ncbi:hypothetical protein Trydic_g14394 [Trypoxylus dichotomus]